MPKSENQKIKLLRLYEYLKMESDENNPKSMKEIIDELNGQGIKCERKSLYSDIKLLNDYGYGIKTVGYRYYLANRDLNLAQIRFLMDATQSAAFLTREQTQELCASIAMLAGSHQAEVLDEKVVTFDKVKHSNVKVLQYVDVINRAIEYGKKIEFKYFKIKLGYKREYRNNENFYKENPIALVFYNGYYYAVCYNVKHSDFVFYRLDRMDFLTKSYEDAESTDKSQYLFDKAKDRIMKSDMWNQGVTSVKILFDKSKIEDVYDKFGMDADIRKYDDNHYCITEDISLTEQFFGWLAGYGTGMKILSPQIAVDKFLAHIDSLRKQYQ